MSVLLTVLLLVLLLAGCNPAPSESVAALPATAATPIAIEPTATSVTSVQPTATSDSVAPVVAAPVAPKTIQATEPLARSEANAPVQLSIPALALDASVVPMGWRVTEINGARTTVWTLPEVGVGWHSNSALAGSVGNVVISGHQLLGDASFASLALGDMAVGEEIFLTDSEGQIFAYQVTTVSEPQPISTDSAEELALAGQYTAQGSTAALTLITGWPDFSSTHRLFVSAEFLGMAE